jgi:hypothetical protein
MKGWGKQKKKKDLDGFAFSGSLLNVRFTINRIYDFFIGILYRFLGFW